MSKRLQELLAAARAKKLVAKQQYTAGGVEPKAAIKLAVTEAKVDAGISSSKPKLNIASLRAKYAAEATTKVVPAIPANAPVSQEAIDEVIENLEPMPTATVTSIATSTSQHTDRYGNTITYNDKQQQFVDLGTTGENCVLIGAAGTGKTTCMQGTVAALIDSGKAGVLHSDGHKYLAHGTPGIVVIAYTRRAVNNIRNAMPEDMKANCITIHKLLEYAPVFYEVFDPETGEERKTMSFEPSRNAHKPLPPSIRTIIVEESSMVALSYYQELIDALGHSVQWIFLGDINQLPPIFGPAILGFKLLQWEVVELTEVYRQALESPIIRLAHRILSGKALPVTEYGDWHVKGQLTIHPWKKKLRDDRAVMTLAKFFTTALDNDIYNVDTDMILLPFNKACGTLELNKYIANHIARKYERVTYEVMAGFEKHYYSVGDKVLYDKEDAEIISIGINAGYAGGKVQLESKTLDYWGYNGNARRDSMASLDSDTEFDLDAMLEEAAGSDSDDRVRQGSHVITLELANTGDNISISSAGDINKLIHGYAITVHKAQGSEWDKVFLCLHQSHNTMLQRELLYTAVTRAKLELYVICEPDSFTKGIQKQKIKGNTLEAKALYFKGKIDNIPADLLAYIHKD